MNKELHNLAEDDSGGDAPYELRRFNFGAFMLTWVWAFAHRLWGWGLLFLILFLIQYGVFQFWLIANLLIGVDLVPFYHFGINPIFILFLIPIKLALSIYFGFMGNRIAWNLKANWDINTFLKSQRFWNIGGSVCMVIFYSYILLLFMTPGFLTAKSGHRFVSCTNELKYISSALHKEIGAYGSLKHIKSIEDVCHRILPKSTQGDKCIGLLNKQFHESCTPGSVKFKIISNKKYELKATSIGSLECKICVTESTVRPRNYSRIDCREFQCIHESKN